MCHKLLTPVTQVHSQIKYYADVQCSSRKVTTVNRKPKAEPNGYRMLSKALDLLHFEPESHRMQ